MRGTRRDTREITSGDQRTALWGGETEKAIANFPISGEPMPPPVIHWLGRIKEAAALVNAELGLLDHGRAERIASAARRVADGELDEHFPVDVFQTGSGTSTHMNANEVIASLAGADVHPNDHVNICQSSNCVVPSAVHLAALEAVERQLCPALQRLRDALSAKAEEFAHVAKSGRTHLMDAVPVTLGQEFGGYASQVEHGIARIESTTQRLSQVPLGGTATGTGLNVHPEFAARVRERLSAETGLPVSAPDDPFEATGARDALVELSGAMKTVAVSLMKIANDIRLLGSGPRTGLRELRLPALQKGSSMMPGKVNPVLPEVVTQVAAQVVGNDAAVTMAGSHGHLELNAFVPVMARNVLDSIALLTGAARAFAERCVEGLEADLDGCRQSAERSLAAATALNPVLGYELVAQLVREAEASDTTLRDVGLARGVAEDVLEAALDPLALTRGGLVQPSGDDGR